MPEILPIGGGKGGVGKSFVAVNLGALIANSGHRVVLLDLDLGASNLHTLLGIKNPRGGIDDFLSKKAATLEKVAEPTPIANLTFISSLHCSMEIANLFHAQKVKLVSAIKTLPFDFIIMDLGAGTNFNTLDFFLASEKGIFVCTPEPTAIENAFRFIKSAYLRKLKQIINLNAFNKMVKHAVLESGRGDLGSSDIIDIVLKYDPGREMFLRESISRFQFGFIMNQFRKNIAPDIGEKMKAVCNRHFYSKFQFFGNVAFDERVSESVLKKKLFALHYPDTEAAAALKNIAERLSQKRSLADRMSEVS
ncbi:MAG: P-loop NTPase [Desulfobacteraceae bacterium]|nr:P-loop NTPase [Desulfobacteraceae bacterium]